MRKKPQPTKKKSTPPKRLRTFQEERDERLGIRFQPIDTEYLCDLGDELLQWVCDTKSEEGKVRVTLTRFLMEKNITFQGMDLWRKRCPYLEDCYQLAKLFIGDRIEHGLLNKHLSEKAAMYVLPRYLPHWKKLDKYHDDRKKVHDVIAALLGKTFEVPQLEGDNTESDNASVEEIPKQRK